jgi:uric acid-xanthine permease
MVSVIYPHKCIAIVSYPVVTHNNIHNNKLIPGIDGRVAYGKLIGTSCLCTLLEISMSIMPVRWLQTAFPPLVTSVTVMLIGVGLIGSGMKSWGGGVVCAEMGWKEHSQLAGLEDDIPLNPSATCVNGEVTLGFGSAEYVGLGFSVVVGLVLIELFGSIFMKNCNVVIALLFGYIIASFNTVNGQQYVESSKIVDARWFTFLWVETFPIGFYAPALVPMLIAYFVTTVETLGTLYRWCCSRWLVGSACPYFTSFQ